MGYNTAIIICNDQLHDLARDPDTGRAIDRMIGEANAGRRTAEGREVGQAAYGRFSMGALPSRHADEGQLILVGGNCIQTVARCWTFDPLEALKQAADQLGYTLHKKPERKPK